MLRKYIALQRFNLYLRVSASHNLYSFYRDKNNLFLL